MRSVNALFDLKKEVVVVTGASGQLGREYVKCFIEKGAKVAALDVSPEVQLMELIKNSGGSAVFIEADVTKKASLQNGLDKIKERMGVPSVLVNNAGIDSPPSAPAEETGPFEDYPEDSWDRVHEVNLKGVFLCCQIFGAEMALSKKGSIVNVSSIYGLVSPDPDIYAYRKDRGEIFFKPVAYSSSKSAILNLTRYLATYWAKQNVRVNCITLAGVFNDQDPEFLNSYCKRIPIGRMADASEYNGPLIFLTSEASSYMTGQNLVVDGGWTSI